MRQMKSHQVDEGATAATAEDLVFSDARCPQQVYFETGVALSLGLAAALIAELLFRFG